MMGSEGPAVQAHSTWCSERHVVRPTGIVADLTVPVVRAAVARRAVTASRSIGYAALAATAGPPKSNSSPVTQMRCMITASLRATVTVARFMPRRLATATPQARRRDHLRVRVMRAGSLSPDCEEIFQEGIIVPPVLAARDGQCNDELFRVFVRNSRFPTMVQGDTRASIAAIRLGERGLTELFERFGRQCVHDAFAQLVERTYDAVRERFHALVPPGEYRFADALDTAGQGHGPVTLRYRLAVTEDRIAREERRAGASCARLRFSTATITPAAARPSIQSLRIVARGHRLETRRCALCLRQPRPVAQSQMLSPRGICRRRLDRSRRTAPLARRAAARLSSTAAWSMPAAPAPASIRPNWSGCGVACSRSRFRRCRSRCRRRAPAASARRSS